MSTRRSRVQAVCWSTAEPCPTFFLSHRRPQTGTFRRWSSLLKYYTMELKRSHTHLEKCCGEEHREEYVMCYTLRFTSLRFNSLHFTLLYFTLLTQNTLLSVAASIRPTYFKEDIVNGPQHLMGLLITSLVPILLTVFLEFLTMS